MASYMIRISTTQFDTGSEPVLEEAPASFRIVNGTRYISYVLPADGDQPAISTIIQINEKSLEVRRNGGIRGKVLYFLGEPAHSQLDLGFLSLDIINETDYLAICEINDNLSVTVRYKLYINGEFISNCEMEMMLTASE
ncbi:MAG: DUF1934 domain-containing protein [Lachnospiraceae bacterium]|nr:DUF1934 domain-containing protein [Lachnospiraceae bacterium]